MIDPVILASSPSQPFYQQLCQVVQQHPDLLTNFKSDLHNHDRRVLDEARPGDQWIWVLRASGTDLISCPLMQINELLLANRDLRSYEIEQRLQEQKNRVTALIYDRQNRFYHLVYRMNGTQEVREIPDNESVSLISPQSWKRFDDWQNAVISKASSLACEISGSSR